MHGMVEGGRGRGQPRASEWTGRSVVFCVREVEDRTWWRKRLKASKCFNGLLITEVT